MKWITGAMMLTFGFAAFGKGFERGFVEVRPGHRLYVEHKRAKRGHQTLFLANGLTYSTTQWRSYVGYLEQFLPDLGIVLFDMEGQGQTLIDRIPNIYGKRISLFDQALDLHDLRHNLGIDGPCVLAGLSYGGAVTLLHAANYPNDFERYIVMAPFLERLEPQDRWVHRQIRLHRLLFPWDETSDETLYVAYLEQLVRTTYPQAEPVILENIFKIEGVVAMVKGSKDFRASDLVDRLPLRKIHVIGGERDEHVKLRDLNAFVDAIRSGPLASFMIFKWTRHKLPELVPKFLAATTAKLMTPPAEYTEGRTFYGDPLSGEFHSGDEGHLLTSKGNFCDRWLQFVSGSR